MKIYLLCPVRFASLEEQHRLETYIVDLMYQGHKIYYPARDTDQDDDIGYRICLDNVDAIREADVVHVFWNPKSEGSKFDLGAAFALNKPIYIINPEDIEPKEGKSFENMICHWSFLSEQEMEF